MKNSKLAIAIITIAAIAIAIGIIGGEPQAVWSKAVRICLECIGIG